MDRIDPQTPLSYQPAPIDESHSPYAEELPDIAYQPPAYESETLAFRGLGPKLLQPTKATLWAAIATILSLALVVTAIFAFALTRQNEAAQHLAAQPQFPDTIIPLANLTTTTPQSLGQLSQVQLNGRLTVNGSLVLAPTDQPTAPQNGELYYDQTTGNVAYYNGTSFQSLVTTASQTVTTIGGLQGSIALGAGLTTQNGRLALTNPAATNIPIPTNYVASLQGRTGAVNLLPGTGIALTETTSGTGTNATTSLSLTNTGVTSIANLSGAVLLGRGLITTNSTLASSITLSSASADLQVTDDGNGNYSIASVGVGQGGTIALAPTTPQNDASTNPSIALNKTVNGNFTQFQANGTDVFVIDQTGAITTGSIAYAQVTGRPTSTVEALGGASGSIAIGSGLSLIGNILSSTSTGITAVNGTANQVSVTTVGGVATVSLPQSITTTADVSFNSLTLATPLGLSSGGTGATTAAGARTNLAAAQSGTNADITSLTGLTSIANTAGLSIGSTAQSLSLQGNTTSLTQHNGANSTTLSFTTPTAANSIILPNASGTVCLSTGNCLGGASGGATTSLNNLANVALNTSLLPGSATIDLGSSTTPFRDAYIGSTATNNFKLTGSASTAQTITFPDATGTVCLTTGNCAGAGGGITGLGSANTIALFTGSGTIGTSMLTQNAGGTTLTVTGDLSVTGSISGNGSNITNLNAGNITNGTVGIANGGTGASNATAARTNLAAAASGANSDITSLTGLTSITPSTSLTIGATTQNLTLQGAATSITQTAGSFTTTLNFANPTQAASVTIPNLSGTVCLTSGNCLGGASGGADTSLSNLVGVALNTSLLPGSATIDLGSSSAPFKDLYLGGTATNNFKLTGSASTAQTITFPDASGTVCLTTGNCAGAGGGIIGSGTANTIALFTGSGTIGNSMLTQNGGGTTLTATGDISVDTLIAGDGSAITSLNASNFATGVVTLANGGAGVSAAPQNGQILIGNGDGYNVATITQGANITVTNTPGGITIDAVIAVQGADRALSNLSDVAINTSLVPGLAGLTLGSVASPFASLVLGVGGNNVTLGATTTQARSLTLPNESGTICLQANSDCNFATAAGSANYIQNQYSEAQSSASYWISGNARADGGVLSPALDTATAAILAVGGTTASSVTLGSVGTTTTIFGTTNAPGSSITLGAVSASELVNNGATINTTKAISNLATGGSIGTAATTVDVYTGFTINQTTAGQTITIPNPTNTAAGRVLYVSNIGTVNFTMGGATFPFGATAVYVWTGSAWVPAPTAGVSFTGVGTMTTGSPSFAAKIDYGTGLQPQSIVNADVNGDGNLSLKTPTT